MKQSKNDKSVKHVCEFLMRRRKNERRDEVEVKRHLNDEIESIRLQCGSIVVDGHLIELVPGLLFY